MPFITGNLARHSFSLSFSLLASSPVWASKTGLARTRERAAKPRPHSRVLARLASLAQIGELARRLSLFDRTQPQTSRTSEQRLAYH